MKKIFAIIFLIVINTSLIGQQLVGELFFNYDSNTKPIAKRSFYYNNEELIDVIIESYKDTNDIIKYKYTYDNGFLKTVEEFLNNVRVNYAVFFYEKEILKKKIEYSLDEKILLTRNYIFKDKKLISIEDYLPGEIYLGKRIFIYKDNKLSEEFLYDEFDKQLITRKYEMKNNMIDSVKYIINDKIIRNVTKQYTPSNIKTNEFYYQYIFWDIR